MKMNLDWLQKAACKNYDGDLWFLPQATPEKVTEQVTKAKAICWGQCPVRVQCLAWANESREGDGIWGGYTSEERRKMHQYEPRTFNPPPRQSKINADKKAAIYSLQLARSVGTTIAAKELKVTPSLLYRAWKKHGLARKGKAA